MDLLKQLRDQGVTIAALISAALFLGWHASGISARVDHLTDRTEVINRKVDRANLNIGNARSDLSKVKMDVNGLEIKMKDVEGDLSLMNRNVSGVSRDLNIGQGRSNRQLLKILRELDEEERIRD